MSTRRISDLPAWTEPCRHPEHEPPAFMVYRPGRYEHTCPGCGRRFTFTVDHGPSLGCERTRAMRTAYGLIYGGRR